MFNICKIKNIDTVDHSILGKVIVPDEEYTIPDIQRLSIAQNDTILLKISNGLLKVGSDIEYFTSISTQLDWLKSNSNEPKDVTITSQPDPIAFAQPTHRTKRNGDAAWTTASADSTTHSDYLITEERYVTGGGIILKNVKQGDYLKAEVRDIDGVIPEAYRSALCESHPTVAEYVIKRWLKPDDGYQEIIVDTYPLNAKISAGLYLRVSLVTSAEAGDREFVVNYHLTKKL